MEVLETLSQVADAANHVSSAYEGAREAVLERETRAKVDSIVKDFASYGNWERVAVEVDGPDDAMVKEMMSRGHGNVAWDVTKWIMSSAPARKLVDNNLHHVLGLSDRKWEAKVLLKKLVGSRSTNSPGLPEKHFGDDLLKTLASRSAFMYRCVQTRMNTAVEPRKWYDSRGRVLMRSDDGSVLKVTREMDISVLEGLSSLKYDTVVAEVRDVSVLGTSNNGPKAIRVISQIDSHVQGLLPKAGHRLKLGPYGYTHDEWKTRVALADKVEQWHNFRDYVIECTSASTTSRGSLEVKFTPVNAETSFELLELKRVVFDLKPTSRLHRAELEFEVHGNKDAGRTRTNSAVAANDVMKSRKLAEEIYASFVRLMALADRIIDEGRRELELGHNGLETSLIDHFASDRSGSDDIIPLAKKAASVLNGLLEVSDITRKASLLAESSNKELEPTLETLRAMRGPAGSARVVEAREALELSFMIRDCVSAKLTSARPTEWKEGRKMTYQETTRIYSVLELLCGERLNGHTLEKMFEDQSRRCARQFVGSSVARKWFEALMLRREVEIPSAGYNTSFTIGSADITLVSKQARVVRICPRVGRKLNYKFKIRQPLRTDYDDAMVAALAVVMIAIRPGSGDRGDFGMISAISEAMESGLYYAVPEIEKIVSDHINNSPSSRTTVVYSDIEREMYEVMAKLDEGSKSVVTREVIARYALAGCAVTTVGGDNDFSCLWRASAPGVDLGRSSHGLRIVVDTGAPGNGVMFRNVGDKRIAEQSGNWTVRTADGTLELAVGRELELRESHLHGHCHVEVTTSDSLVTSGRLLLRNARLTELEIDRLGLSSAGIAGRGRVGVVSYGP